MKEDTKERAEKLKALLKKKGIDMNTVEQLAAEPIDVTLMVAPVGENEKYA